MKPFSLLIKPSSADCNMQCTYCFYLAKRELYPQTQKHRMSDSILEQMIKSYLSTEQPAYTFGWQGGEPTLMGLNFFKRISELQKKHAPPNAQIVNGLQTNGTLITDPLAKHLARHRFLVGCSLDGPPELHNRYRRFANQKGSHSTVLKGIMRLKKHGVEFNILVLVSKSNVQKAKEVYQYLTKQGFHYHQYIPCVEFDQSGNLLPFSITGEEWGQFLCELFDLWYQQDVYRISIRNFDDLLNKMSQNLITSCSLAENCCQYFVVEHNGDIYPCDFLVKKDLHIGNISEITWDSALSSPVYQKFGFQKSKIPQDCHICEHFDLCLGDCPKHRNKTVKPNAVSYLCKGWKKFFCHSRESFTSLVQKNKYDQVPEIFNPQSAIQNNKIPSVGRNQLCSCGSGRKFKKCCLK